MKGTSAQLLLLLVFLLVSSCWGERKVSELHRHPVSPSLELSDDIVVQRQDSIIVSKDTLLVTDLEGNEVFIMKAVRDEAGEMVATDVLDAALVTARFRNVAERHGSVDLRFRITVPSDLIDSKWQLRFRPLLRINSELTDLDSLIITGSSYRKAQLRGYELYEKYLNSIITDTSIFLNKKELEIFFKRNSPALYQLKHTDEYVDEEQYASIFGVTRQEAVDHYTNQAKKMRNDRRIKRIPKIYSKYVRVPIVTEGIRLDTVLVTDDGSFAYEYVHTLKTRPGLKKAEILLSGNIYERDRQIYSMPECQPLSYYISSLSTFADMSERYLTKVIERNVEAHTACYVAFDSGKDVVDEALGENRTEIGRIKDNLNMLLDNAEFAIDSVVVTATCSPEGSYAYNVTLSRRRSESISRYFHCYLNHRMDSLRLAEGFSVNEQGEVTRSVKANADIDFLSRYVPENWAMLDVLVRDDEQIPETQKKMYESFANIVDPDMREYSLQRLPSYLHMRESLYPRLRTVKFDFFLHRKGMVKDTIHTTLLDSTYMKGALALSVGEYERAVTILRPYADFNTAVAYCAMDYNSSALSVLENLPPDARVNYMLAIVYSRMGEEQKAVQCYMHACEQNPSFVHRGNLDPEITVLINRYNINQIQTSL